MKILLWIILILSAFYVCGMIFCLCYTAMEASKAEKEILEKKEKERERDEDWSD